MNMYEFRDVPGAGTGTFATQDIARGTIIMDEAPLMSTNKDAYTLEFYNQYLERPNEDRIRFERLFVADNRLEHARESIRKKMDSDPTQGTNETLDHRARVASIHTTNSFNIYDHRGAIIGTAVYDNQSRLNHMCSNNMLQCPPSSIGGLQSMQAKRNIKAGEELTDHYIRLVKSVKLRREETGDYGFACVCPLCEMDDYVYSTPDVTLDIFGRSLKQRHLTVMIRFFRFWFDRVQSEEGQAREKEAEVAKLYQEESVLFSEVAFEILQQIVGTKRILYGTDSAEYQQADKNVECWTHVMADLEDRYGNGSVWLDQINASDPRMNEQ